MTSAHLPDPLVLDLARQILAAPDADWRLATLAAGAASSPIALRRRFISTLGVSPKMLVDAARFGRLKGLLRQGQPILEAILDAGYGSTSRVYTPSARRLGMSLASYRRGAPREQLSWAQLRTSFGWLLIAATDRGVCFAQFGDHAPALAAQLAAEFPQAQITRCAAQSGASGAAHAALAAWAKAVAAHLATGRALPELPLDLRGTAFQLKVWQFLTSLPRGQTCSYAELARAIGEPRAVRAAASACAANRIAILVPCHRVLRSDGALGGYRWGLERKQALLADERRGGVESSLA